MKTVSIAVAGLLLAACGGAADDGEPADATETEAARGGVIGEGYVDALEKAETVEDLARERKEALDEAADSPE